MSQPNIKIISTQEAYQYDDDFDAFACLDPDQVRKVLLIEGDVEIEGDFFPWFVDLLTTQNIIVQDFMGWDENGDDAYWEKVQESAFVIFLGNVDVKGEVIDPPMFIKGNLSCDYLYSSGNNATITGNADIKYAFFGEYPEGSIQIFGKTKVPFFLNATHSCDCTLHENTVTFGINDDSDFDLNEADFPSILLPQFYDNDDGYVTIKIRPFVNQIKNGNSPFLNLSDEAFSLDFSKEDFLNKIRLGDANLVKSYTIKYKKDLKEIVKMKNLEEVIFTKEMKIPQKTIDACSFTKIQIGTRLVRDKGMAAVIGSFSQIEELTISDGDYYDFDLDEFAPDLFKNLQKLKKLRIRKMSQVAFDLLPALETLFVEANNPNYFSGSHNGLKNLTIEGARGDIRNLHEFPKLEYFSLKGSEMNAASRPLDLAHLKTVNIDVGSNPLPHLEHLYSLPNLTHLDCTFYPGPDSIKGISKLTQLTHLTFQRLIHRYDMFPDEAFSRDDLEEISNLSNLRNLTFTDFIVKKDEFRLLVGTLPDCEINLPVLFLRTGDWDHCLFTLHAKDHRFRITLTQDYEDTTEYSFDKIDDLFEKLDALEKLKKKNGYAYKLSKRLSKISEQQYENQYKSEYDVAGSNSIYCVISVEESSVSIQKYYKDEDYENVTLSTHEKVLKSPEQAVVFYEQKVQEYVSNDWAKTPYSR